ncbi:c-type cytochrome [Candidatus Ferrigenium straubiae]|jgi:hypothetical protein|uniref:c-type cytochrome n=1 Tax=Candidatus Ferrigenium straubiae TaxID=2919506 RepID=UPI003F4AB009
MKKVVATLLLLCGAAGAQASSFADSDVCPPIVSSAPQASFVVDFSGGDPEAGARLFDEYKCSGCHIDKVGGDGSAIFTRPDRMATKPEELVKQMTQCSGILGKTLTPQEQQHLGAYLDRRYYRFGQSK